MKLTQFLYYLNDSGPSSKDPLTKQTYGSSFPLISVFDIVKSQFMLLDHLGIKKVLEF